MGTIRSRILNGGSDQDTRRQLTFMEDLSKSMLNNVAVKDKDELSKIISSMGSDPDSSFLLKHSGTLRLLLQMSTEYSTDPYSQKLRDDAAHLFQNVALSGYSEKRSQDVHGPIIIRMLNCLRLFCFHECGNETAEGNVKFTCTTKFTCMKTLHDLDQFLQVEGQLKSFCKLCGVDALAMLMVTRQQTLTINCDPQYSFVIKICNILSKLCKKEKKASYTRKMLLDNIGSNVLSTPGILSAWRSYLETDNKDLRLALTTLIIQLAVGSTDQQARLLSKEEFTQVLIKLIMEDKSTWKLTLPTIKELLNKNPLFIDYTFETEGFVQFLISQYVVHSTSDINVDHLLNMSSILSSLMDRIVESEELFAVLLSSGILWICNHQLMANHRGVQKNAYFLLEELFAHYDKRRLMSQMGLLRAMDYLKHSTIIIPGMDFDSFSFETLPGEEKGDKSDMVMGA